MSFLRRATPQATRRVQSAQLLKRQCRRFAHDEHAGHGHGHAQEQPESFGKGFYFTVALIPAAFLLYTVRPPAGSATDANPITNLIQSWREIKEDVAARNALHTRLVEEAGYDKVLFINSGGGNRSLRYPEVFGHGSPINVPAGHQADLSQLVRHYEEKASEYEKEEQEKVQKLRNDAQAGKDVSSGKKPSK